MTGLSLLEQCEEQTMTNVSMFDRREQQTNTSASLGSRREEHTMTSASLGADQVWILLNLCDENVGRLLRELVYTSKLASVTNEGRKEEWVSEWEWEREREREREGEGGRERVREWANAEMGAEGCLNKQTHGCKAAWRKEKKEYKKGNYKIAWPSSKHLPSCLSDVSAITLISRKGEREMFYL